MLVQTDQIPQFAFPARVPVISPFCRDEGGSCLSQVWEERLGSCERAVNQAFVAMVCLHVSASPSSARGPGAGDHPPQQFQMRREGACSSGSASGLSVTHWLLSALLWLFICCRRAGPISSSLSFPRRSRVPLCRRQPTFPSSARQTKRGRSEAVVHSRPSSPLSIQSPYATRRSRINTANNMPGIRKLVELSVPALLLL